VKSEETCEEIEEPWRLNSDIGESFGTVSPATIAGVFGDS
jgi:hypothetical protein